MDNRSLKKVDKILKNPPTVVIENMVAVNENESCNDSNATIKCGNKIYNLRCELKSMPNTIIKDQQREKLEKCLSNNVSNTH